MKTVETPNPAGSTISHGTVCEPPFPIGCVPIAISTEVSMLRILAAILAAAFLTQPAFAGRPREVRVDPPERVSASAHTSTTTAVATASAQPQPVTTPAQPAAHRVVPVPSAPVAHMPLTDTMGNPPILGSRPVVNLEPATIRMNTDGTVDVYCTGGILYRERIHPDNFRRLVAENTEAMRQCGATNATVMLARADAHATTVMADAEAFGLRVTSFAAARDGATRDVLLMSPSGTTYATGGAADNLSWSAGWRNTTGAVNGSPFSYVANYQPAVGGGTYGMPSVVVGGDATSRSTVIVKDDPENERLHAIIAEQEHRLEDLASEEAADDATNINSMAQ